MDRAAAFRQFIAKSPNDPFPRYGLAMELKTRGDLAAAMTEFRTLVEQFPDYVPAYLMAGQTASAAGNVSEAKELYTLGLSAAGRKGDQHAAKELQGALAELVEMA